ncbi:SOS response-associated peptidase family protein [Pseudomonas tussilaginis]|uniref:hypothetical protein n=1 Tax=Pseudomonas TaxID=286 RepID=UPI0035938D4D
MLFELISGWNQDAKIACPTYNARPEIAAVKLSFCNTRYRAQYCIIPTRPIYEPDRCTGKLIVTRISCLDNEPMGILGCWSAGLIRQARRYSGYSMLTVIPHVIPHGFRATRP